MVRRSLLVGCYGGLVDSGGVGWLSESALLISRNFLKLRVELDFPFSLLELSRHVFIGGTFPIGAVECLSSKGVGLVLVLGQVTSLEIIDVLYDQLAFVFSLEAYNAIGCLLFQVYLLSRPEDMFGDVHHLMQAGVVGVGDLKYPLSQCLWDHNLSVYEQ